MPYIVQQAGGMRQGMACCCISQQGGCKLGSREAGRPQITSSQRGSCGLGNNMCSPFQRISVVPCSHRIELNQTSIEFCNLSCQTAAPAAAIFRACSRCSCRCCCILCCRRCCSTAAAALAAAAAAAQHLLAQLFESHNREQRPLGVWLNLQKLLRQSNVGTTKRLLEGNKQTL